METATENSLLIDGRVFRGDAESPFLAPRGVFIHGGKLFVSDTGQNRVFIWNSIPEDLNQPADVVLGQQEINQTGRNSGENVSAQTLQYPSGIWSNGEKLIVADAWNHRVLIWLQLPTKHGQPADVVLGQPDFESNQPNVKGIGNDPTSQSLNWPYGVFSDGKQLWIADTGNRRILHFESIPTASYTAADGVIGKPNFNDRDYENTDPIWPYSVKLNSNGSMAVADTQYYRVLLWHNWKTAFTQKADVIIGQEAFDNNGQNQFRLFPEAFTLNWCYDTCFVKDGLWVADTGNSRILQFNEIPTKNSASADQLIGHADFKTGSENKDTILGTDRKLYWPFSISVEGETIAIADTGNHRIIIQKQDLS